MTEKSENRESVKHLPPWVGVVLSFLVTGAAQFFSGKKSLGIKWYAALFLIGFFASWLLVSPIISGIIARAVGFAGWFAVWLWMLRDSYRPVPRLKWSAWFALAVFFFISPLVQGLIMRQFFQPFYMPSNSMAPTIQGASKPDAEKPHPGDYVLIEKYAYWFSKPKTGDLIVFRTDGIQLLPQNEIYVKRVVGVPGDNISIKDGHIFNNGSVVMAPECFKKLTYSAPPGPMRPPSFGTETEPFHVPTSGYFVIGDNSMNSFDSRYWGPVTEGNIIGKATKIYWPLDRVRKLE
jgi:signal peptidase I